MSNKTRSLTSTNHQIAEVRARGVNTHVLLRTGRGHDGESDDCSGGR